ncbi:MAG: hypothetical protein IT303_07505 [Dehalococcoidia bacterium]|nr:hypothetical protein [Dehalococcoidia bacterium]
MGFLAGIIRQRCPRCRKGPIFRGLMTTRERCTVCGLVYQREYGYFYGAMYASYAFGLVTTAYWIPMLVLGVNPVLVVLIPTVHLILQIPMTFRYSRVIWLYLDHRFDPEAMPGTGGGAAGGRHESPTSLG